MTQDNIQQEDTSQGNSNEQQYNSLEEAVFGNSESSDDISGAFTSGTQENIESAPEGQPDINTQETTQEPVQTNNDETRYQYWQSQADKYKNELDALKQQPAPQKQTEAPAQPAEEHAEEFPAPPSKPQRPRTFSREESYTDPSSESARYSDELEEWRDNMNEYSTLKSQYQTAVIEDKFNKMEQTRVDEVKRQQASQQKSAQEAEIKSHVMGHYGMKDGEANDFMSKMSDPNSITVDNLVQLYRMQQGNAAPQQNTAPAIPSATFSQTKNAQQVPSSMGVMPSGQSNIDGRTMEDKMMDSMIGNFNSKNPWK